LTLAVLDASLVAAILLPDEWTEATTRLQRQLDGATLHVPAHWAVEIGSLLTMAKRRGRITDADRIDYIAMAKAFDPVVDEVSLRRSVEITDLALETGLSVYDAAYLELAMRLGTALATNDRALAAAGRARNITIWSTLS
jgi:predicted nucleic acid-binding protein